VLVGRQQARTARVKMIARGAIPEGFVYVPGGPFLYGTTEEDLIAQEVQPLHEVELPSFFIAQNEVTFGDWLPYRAATGESLVLLKGTGDHVAIDLGDVIVEVGKPLEYSRTRRGERARAVDWTRLPVVGSTHDQAVRFAASSQARLCADREWEKAARGADGRIYPHGVALRPEDASSGTTDGAAYALSRLPDPVGEHTASRSVFGVNDLVGNASEWTAQLTVRGGAYLSNNRALRSDFRYFEQRNYDGLDVGVRLCRDPVAQP
jgi:formylglycine-generating enzyme required for sulfatase activity